MQRTFKSRNLWASKIITELGNLLITFQKSGCISFVSQILRFKIPKYTHNDGQSIFALVENIFTIVPEEDFIDFTKFMGFYRRWQFQN